MTCPRSHSSKSQTDSQVLYHQSGILRPSPTPTEHGLGRKGYLDIECLVYWTEEQGRGPDARLRARQRPACAWVPRAQGGTIQRLPLPAHGWNRTVSFAAGLLPPGKSMFVLAHSERAWAGSLPRGLALARHSCRLDTMSLTQIPHT